MLPSQTQSGAEELVGGVEQERTGRKPDEKSETLSFIKRTVSGMKIALSMRTAPENIIIIQKLKRHPRRESSDTNPPTIGPMTTSLW